MKRNTVKEERTKKRTEENVRKTNIQVNKRE